MSEKDKVHAIEVRCDEILRSPYMFKDLPEELKRLRTVMRNVETLIREDVPYLLAEIKHLRTENKHLNAALADSASSVDDLKQTLELDQIKA
jgi:regulator of replication initiation timing